MCLCRVMLTWVTLIIYNKRWRMVLPAVLVLKHTEGTLRRQDGEIVEGEREETVQEEKQHERTTQRNSDKVFLILIKSWSGCCSSSRHRHMPNHEWALPHSEDNEITQALAMGITGERETDKYSMLWKKCVCVFIHVISSLSHLFKWHSTKNKQKLIYFISLLTQVHKTEDFHISLLTAHLLSQSFIVLFYPPLV